MRNPLLVIFSLILILLTLSLSCSPSPQEYAGATATLWRAEALRTADAIQNNATATSVSRQSNATATAEPHNAGRALTQASTDNLNAWLTQVVLVALALTCGALIGLAVVAILRRRAHTLSRDQGGQLPAWVENGAITDPARMIGSTVVARQDPLNTLERLVEWARTGQLPPPAEPQIIETDHGATPEQLLEIAQDAQRTATVAAMFRPGNGNEDRAARLRLVPPAIRNLLNAPTPPTGTRVVQNDDAVKVILALIQGKAPPELQAGTPAVGNGAEVEGDYWTVIPSPQPQGAEYPDPPGQAPAPKITT